MPGSRTTFGSGKTGKDANTSVPGIECTFRIRDIHLYSWRVDAPRFAASAVPAQRLASDPENSLKTQAWTAIEPDRHAPRRVVAGVEVVEASAMILREGLVRRASRGCALAVRRP